VVSPGPPAGNGLSLSEAAGMGEAATADRADALVELRQVSKSFGGAPALAPTSLSFARGRTTVLIGPSGCGKSTLLRLIIRLLEPETGTVQFDGTLIDAENIAHLRRRIGYVIQDGGLFPHLTARDNVLLLPRHLGRSMRQMEERIGELCQLTRLPLDALDRFPRELSGGQRQRVSLMRALVLSPELLLLDEPLAALDPLVRAALQQDLKEIFRELNQTAIFVTHDLAEAAYLGHTIVLMNNGRVVQQGRIEELRDAPAESFVTEFINAQRVLTFA
jgi:osmoprotectant transport system ATP-binding protein